MADGKSKLAWSLFRSIGLGSKQVLGSPALVCGTFFKLSYQFRKTNYSVQQSSSSSFKFHTPTATIAPAATRHGKVCQILSQCKLALSPTNNSFRDHVVGRGYRSIVDRYRLGDVKKKGYPIILVSAVAAATAAYLSSYVETVPYSKRTHLVLISRRAEMQFGNRYWKRFTKKNRDKILPHDHPTSVRVRSIKNKIVEALERGLEDDKVWGPSKRMLFWQRDPMQQRESYLDYIHKWEIVVVDDPNRNNAKCNFGGKMKIYTGLLNTLESDAEIATIIGHEVGHAVGRHRAEKSVWATFLALPARLLVFRDMDAVRDNMKSHPSFLSFSRKLELEADYIGFLLMASAGYDPSIAVEVRKKRAKLKKKRVEAMSTHPSGERRVELAVQTQEEAMVFYEESLSRN